MLTQRQLDKYRGQVKGQPCRIEELTIAALTLNPCQRILDQQHAWQCVRRAGGLDWNLFQPLNVVRKSTGQLEVIDGQHRLEILRMVLPEQKTVQCRVIETDSNQEAARLFTQLNLKLIKRVKDTDLLWAEIIEGDERALKTEKFLVDNELSTGRINQEQAKNTVDLPSLRRCLQWGVKETARAVALFRQAWPLERVINGDVLTGMVRLLTFDHYREDLAENTMYGEDFDRWFVAVFQHLDVNRAKYENYRQARAGWFDGVAWGLLEDFTASQLRRLRGAPNNRVLKQQHGFIK